MPTDPNALLETAIAALRARVDSPEVMPLPDVERAVTQALLSGIDAPTLAAGAALDPLDLLPFVALSVVPTEQHRDVVQLRLELLRGQYDAANQRLHDVRTAIGAEMRDLNADGAGVPETHLAAMFRVTRPTVRNFLGKKDPNFKSARANR
ncbi:hypothetical protein [Nocardia brasiliensis]|uniref:hypothetical protein n=1 Tax=Nocardia brasiliensis TaxID=37326 RepID=UPI002457C008|nr:hypothetical protein [Nocardia brasiliensis]